MVRTAPITFLSTLPRSPILLSGTRTRGALLAFACTFAGTVARADTPAPPGADALATARSEWAEKHYSAAELSYKSALDQGGLAPADTLDAYVHLGAARARHGKKELARAAFRQAALIDRHFKTPPEGGKRAATIAALARRDEAKLGSIVHNATFPVSVPAAEAFGIDATLDAKHAAVTAKVGVDARDPVSGRHWSTVEVAGAKVHFEVPANIASSGAVLVVRVDALDPHENRLASRARRGSRVETEPAPAEPLARTALAPPLTPPPLVPPSLVPPPAAAPNPLAFNGEVAPPKPAKEGGKHGGVFSSPWFYIIGGVILAAGGAFAFYELRPSDDVSLGGARVVTR